MAPPPLHLKDPQFGADIGGVLYPPLGGGPVPYLGGLVTLVGKDDAHYEGTLMGVNPVTTEISVANGVYQRCNSDCW